MRISVIIPSRKRVPGLVTMLKSLHILESRKHTVTYAVACDSDDAPTIDFCKSFQKQMPLALSVHPGRPPSLGGMVNLTAEQVPADVYTSLSDDTLCITPHWDAMIADAAAATPHGVFWWKDAGPADAAYAIVTEKWRAAMGGLFSTHFPYWFDDLWLAEVWTMATCSAPIVLEAKLVDCPRQTMRMRELPFWVDFYFRTRGVRALDGRRIAATLGLPTPLALDELMKVLDTIFSRASEEELLKVQATQGEPELAPDANYTATKARAVALLNSL